MILLYILGELMNVVYASDENYIPYLGVSLYSLLKNNNHDFDEIFVYILDTGIELKSKEKLEKLCCEYDAKISFLDVENIESKIGLKIKSNMAISAYSRLFISSLVNEDVEKILYLDSDSLVEGSFKHIWDCDIDDYYCAGVLDTTLPFYKKSVGLSENDDYINSGFLFINLKKWRLDNVEEKFIDFITYYNGKVIHNDQGIINGTLHGKILIINPCYNLLSTFYEIPYDDVKKWYGLDDYYNKRIVENCVKYPIFVHFTNFIKGRPWFNNKKHPLYKEYKEYVLKSPFKDRVYITDDRSFKLKFFSFISNIFPLNIVSCFYKIYTKFFIKYF